MERGATLLELTVVLVLVGIGVAHAVPLLGAGLDRWAVRGARDALIGAFDRVRAEAVARGGAALVLRADSTSVLVESAARSERLELAAGRPVIVELPPSGSTVRLRFDRMGIGRMTSRTVRLRRGGHVAELVIGSFGRVSRR